MQQAELTSHQQTKGFMLMNGERLYSIEYSVSIIPEAGFRMFYRISDVIDDWLQIANEKNLLLRALRVQVANKTQ